MRWIWISSMVLSALAIFTISSNRSQFTSCRQTLQASVLAKDSTEWNAAPNQPFCPKPTAPRFLASDSQEARLVDSLLAKPPGIPMDDVSTLCHLLLAYRDSPIPLAQLSSRSRVFSVLTNWSLAKEQFGEVPFFTTRYGIRYRMLSVDKLPIQRGESHRDLCLATFAEIGLPLDSCVLTSEGTRTIRDLLRDSIATFDVHEAEIAWTAIAYTLYMPRQSSWMTRDNDRFTFDDLANELLQRPLSRASCGGAHLLMAMTLLLRADADQRCISSETRGALVRQLRDWARIAASAQCGNGSWIATWYRAEKIGPAVSASLFGRMLVTGHLLEWMEYLPSELQPDQSVYRAAVGWLIKRLPELAALRQFPAQMFCPWTHSVSGLRNLVQKNEKNDLTK